MDLRERLSGMTGYVAQPAPEAEWLSETELRLGGRPATFLRPDGPGPHPAVLYCHAHGGNFELGRRELVEGRRAIADPPWGRILPREGYAVLCLDMAGFGDRREEGAEGALAKAALWRGDTLFGAMLRDLGAGLSWLIDGGAPFVATLGLSMGAAHAWWLAALDRRVAAVVQLCMLADMRPLIASGIHDRHGHYLTVPGLLEVAEMGDVAGLVAPRPQFIGHGAMDGLTPGDARDAALRRVRSAYGGGALEEFLDPGNGHVETPSMRAAALDFLHRARRGSG